MRIPRLFTAITLGALTIGGSLLLAVPAQAQVVAAGGTYTTTRSAYGETRIQMDGPRLSGYVSATDNKTDGLCARARVVYRNDANAVVLTSQTTTSCVLGMGVQISLPVTYNVSISKAVLEVWAGTTGAKTTRTFGIG